MELLQWQNLIFLMPIAMGALYLVLLAIGSSFGAETGDAGLDHDTDVAIDQGDVSLEHGDVALDHGADFDQGDVAHGDVDQDLAPSIFGALVGFLGVGKVPFSILMMSYCFVWGAAGLASITLLGKDAVWTAVAVAIGAAVLVTRYLAAGIARIVPSAESYHTPQRQLVGLRGEVLYEITDSSGMARVRDERQDQRDVSCRVAPGAKAIPAGTTVVLLRYDAAARVFVVEP